MKIHYFQRYHAKENVATANTMLLLSRLYQYSTNKFFQFLKSKFFLNNFEPEIVFNLQEKSKSSVPDATITQESFKLVVETKTSDWFHADQLIKHLEAFGDEKCKVLITLAPALMGETKKAEFNSQLKKHNESLKYPIIHINTTFEEIVSAIEDCIDDRDYEMHDILEDYKNYCYNDNLIIVPDSWKYMRVQLAGTTFHFNMKENIYYDDAGHGFRPHDYLGLYREKSVRAIGKISSIITATFGEKSVEYKVELGELTEERKEKISKAVEDGKNYGYTFTETRFFFVDKFHKTDFKKSTPRAPMGTRIFDLTQVLDVADLEDYTTERIAWELASKEWQ